MTALTSADLIRARLLRAATAALRMQASRITLLAALLAASAAPAVAQSAAVRILLDRAHTQEQAGHGDLAAQTWQQVLLADPNNTEALAGLARWARRAGNNAQADKYVERLKQINPADPEISHIQNLSSTRVQNQRLEEAAKLAQNGHPQEALAAYRGIFGNTPPDGDWALAYYNTMASVPAERDGAIDGLRGLARKYPADTRYSITLGRILTYTPKTRAEGERILREHDQDVNAQTALRQALVWDAQNPSAAPAIRDYLKQHKDEELARDLSEAQSRQAAASTPAIAQNPAEGAAYRALNDNQVDVAQSRFQALIAQQPHNPRALAGMGFVRMKQGNFADAANYLEQAQQNGSHDASVASALTTSRFWNTMQQGTAALNDNRLSDATSNYQSALALRPDSQEALEGLSGVYMKAGQPGAAIAIYQKLTKLHPNSVDAWRGLFNAQVQSSQYSDALATSRSLPPVARDAMAQDPQYLTNLAAAYKATGQDAEAQRVLAQALSIPFPDNGKNLKASTRLQYASILMANQRYEQAAGLYRDVLADDPMNVPAWQGLVSVQHQSNHDAEAVETIERMPPSAYESAMQDSGFLSLVAAIYQQQNHPDVAIGFLERAAKLSSDKGQTVPTSLELQIAALRLEQNDPAGAYAVYRQVLITHPDHLDGWKGLMSALHQTGHDTDALAQMQQIPPDIRRQLESDPDYLQTVAAIYASTGNQKASLQILAEIQDHYRGQHAVPPADVDIQSAWLLYNAGNDATGATQLTAERDLYRALMALGSRRDLTDDQRRRVQTIWASWSVRRASQAAEAGDSHKALQLLQAAQQAFPGNPDVTKALAGGYLRAGQPKAALAIYNSPELADAMQNPTVADYQGMVGAALAAPNLAQAETWLNKALATYPNDPSVLALAARFEQARGDNARAAAYWKASIAAMPPVSPANQLAHILDRPDIVNPSQTLSTPSLAGLLDPDGQATPQTAPALPGYGNGGNVYVASGQAPLLGPDPYKTGSAPVVLNGAMSGGAAGDSNSRTTTTTTTTTTYARVQPTVKHTTTVHHAAASSTTTTTTSSVQKPAPTTTASATPAPVHHYRKRVYSGVSNPPSDQTYTTTQTTTSYGGNSTAGSGASNTGSSSERLGDYSPQSSLHMPMIPAGRLPDAAQPTERITSQPASEMAQAQDAFAPPAMPQARADADLASGNGENAANAAQLHLGITAANPAEAHWNTLAVASPAPMPQPEPVADPVELTLDSSRAIQYVPNGSPTIEAYNRASAALADAQRPVNAAYLDSAYVDPQATGASQQITQSWSALGSSTGAPTSTPYLPSQMSFAQPATTTTTTTQPSNQSVYGGQRSLTGWAPVKQTTVTTVTTVAENEGGPLPDAPQQQDLPPLRGPWGAKRVIKQRDPREDAAMQLAMIEGGYSPWLGGNGYIGHRSGSAGIDQLTMFEAPIEASTPLGGSARLTVVTTPSFLDSGVLTSSSVSSTTVGGGTTANQLGTLAPGSAAEQQNASGVGGEVQLTAANWGAAVGYTPYEFLVSNVIGRFNWRPAAGPFTFTFNRDAVKDSQLSYAGLRDPGSASSTYSGNIWGGVITNAFNLQYAKGDAKSGYYIGMGGQYLTGHHVEDNKRIDGVAGAYWHVLSVPDQGDLTIGTNFFGMHYTNNLRYFTYGQGGYFSPSAYMLANVPVTWSGHYGVNLHYTVAGAFGLQAFQEEATPLFPLDPALQTANDNPYYSAQSVVGGNYDLHGEMSYHLTDHWYIGGFLALNNTRDYGSQTVGFFVRFLGRPQYPSELGPTGLFPYQGNRPLMVP
ncbi:cellulose synthase subunit BcsC-related outer membrane protein [Silvibacterium sp.]|uniref:cellulose synthase subunit BcsC-related outer membrane protein n=1 Tax=Silvibacterium sp. TaxID=1964179 RepID=UPI0039E46390